MDTTAKGLRIRLLGGFGVQVDDRAVPDTAWRRKAASLFKLLALAPGHFLHREAAHDRLWPEFGPRAAANNLHRTLHVVRHVLEPNLPPASPSAYIRLHGDIVRLTSPSALWVDVEAFEVARAAALGSRQVEAYLRALDLYTGDLLPEDRYAEWATNRREELRGQYLALSVETAAQHEARGEYLTGIRVLEQALAAEPTHEEAHVRLIRLLALHGERFRALRHYQLLRDILRREVGVGPAATARRLYQDIMAGRFPAHDPMDPDIDGQVAPPPAATARPPALAGGPGRATRGPTTNLPAPTSSFVGRENEITDVRQLLATARMVTLTGAGGVGKTRLALRIAAEVLDEYPDGVWHVDLAALEDERLVQDVTAALFGLQRAPDRPLLEQLTDALSARCVLLVLDNCEHLAGASAELVEHLLRSCPRVRILATSRVTLHVPGQTSLRLFGAAEALHEVSQQPLLPPDRPDYEAGVAAARARLSGAAFDAAWAHGRAMQLDDAIQFALGGQERAARAESPPAHLTDLLSAREREVMALIERKLTNREIAAQLGVARRTVDTHVSRILNKLGLASRAQVAR